MLLVATVDEDPEARNRSLKKPVKHHLLMPDGVLHERQERVLCATVSWRGILTDDPVEHLPEDQGAVLLPLQRAKSRRRPFSFALQELPFSCPGYVVKIPPTDHHR